MKARKVTVAKNRISAPSHKNRTHNRVYASIRFETLLKKVHKKLSAFIRGGSSWMKHSLKHRIIFGGVSVCILVGLLVIVITALAGSPAEASGRYTASSAKPSALQAAAPASNPTPTPIKTTAPEPSPSPTPKATDSPKPSTKPSTKPSAKPTPKPTKKPTSTANLTELAKFYISDSDKFYSDYGYSSNSYNYNENDVTILARVITKEAGGEATDGQLAVGNVVMNRVLCGRFGSSLEAVATAPGQFAYDSSIVPKQSCLNAARDVLQNEHWVIAQNVYYFKAGGSDGSSWGNHPFYSKIGNQSFYSANIGKRYNGKGIPPKLFSRIYKWPQYGCQPGKGVSRIQHMLSTLGYDTDKDGYFGKTTKEALIKFQKSKGIKGDGVAGASTIKALIKAYGKDKYVKDYGS